MQILEETAKRYAREWASLRENDELERPTLSSISKCCIHMRLHGKDTSDLDAPEIQANKENLAKFLELVEREVKTYRSWSSLINQKENQSDEHESPDS